MSDLIILYSIISNFDYRAQLDPHENEALFAENFVVYLLFLERYTFTEMFPGPLFSEQ